MEDEQYEKMRKAGWTVCRSNNMYEPMFSAYKWATQADCDFHNPELIKNGQHPMQVGDLIIPQEPSQLP